MKLKTKRPKRTKVINVRISEDELERIKTNANGKNQISTFMRTLALNPQRKQDAPQTIKQSEWELVRQLKALGNNLNQIAYQVNRGAISGKLVDAGLIRVEIAQIREELEKLKNLSI